MKGKPELVLREGVYYVRGTVTNIYGDRVRLRKSTTYGYHSRSLAEKRMGEIVSDAINTKVEVKSKPVENTLRVVLHTYQKKGGMEDTNNSIINRLDKDMGHMKVEDVTSLKLHNWLNNGERKGSSVKRMINAVSAAFKYCEPLGIPVPDVTFQSPDCSDSDRCRWLSEEDQRRVIEGMPCDDSFDLAAFLFYTGARTCEARALKSHEVRDGEVILWSRKGRKKKWKSRRVPLHPAIRSMVERRARETNGHVFTYMKRVAGRGFSAHKERAPWGKDAFRSIMDKVTERLGIEDFTVHDCRHTFASHLVQRGASLRAVADLLGHSSLAMVMRYAHLSQSHLKTTVDLLDGTKVSRDTVRDTNEGLVPPERIELSASALPRQRSTTELRRHKQTTFSNTAKDAPLQINLSNAVDEGVSRTLTKEQMRHPKHLEPD